MASTLTFPALNIYLLIGGALSFIAAGLHIACIVGGADWLRFFGAGEKMARMAEQGSWYPGLVTGVIAVALMVMGSYALVGAAGGEAALPLPFVKWVLVAIATVYMVRGSALIPLYFIMPAKLDAFALWSSLIVLTLGILHTVGLWKVWENI
jgi:hypothetical protein